MYIVNLIGKKKLKYLAWGLAGLFVALFALLPAGLTGRDYLLASAAAQVRAVPIYQVDRSDKVVAISFDAAWGAERTPQILDILDKYDVKSTFFLVNIWLDDYPEMAQEIARRGHEIGLHSTTHPHFTKLEESQMKSELLDNFQLIEQVTGQQPTLFRAPFGDYNNHVLNCAASLGFTTIQWSVDSLDWKELSAPDIEQRVMSRIKNGDIVLFHNNGTNTPAAVDNILHRLTAEGYQIIPISQMLLQGDTYNDMNGTQKLR